MQFENQHNQEYVIAIVLFSTAFFFPPAHLTFWAWAMWLGYAPLKMGEWTSHLIYYNNSFHLQLNDFFFWWWPGSKQQSVIFPALSFGKEPAAWGVPAELGAWWFVSDQHAPGSRGNINNLRGTAWSEFRVEMTLLKSPSILYFKYNFLKDF